MGDRLNEQRNIYEYIWKEGEPQNPNQNHNQNTIEPITVASPKCLLVFVHAFCTQEKSPANLRWLSFAEWFSSWFDSRPKRKVRRRSTTSTSTTSTTTTSPSAAAQVPILTIVDPLRNPQNWIGILAHHIVNSTSTTTSNPLIQALATRMTTRGTTSTSSTTTATSRPEVPRRINYDNYQIWRLKPQDEAQVRALEDFKKAEDGVKMQWLKGPSLRWVLVIISHPLGTLNNSGASLSFLEASLMSSCRQRC